jgi:hypothetical protein
VDTQYLRSVLEVDVFWADAGSAEGSRNREVLCVRDGNKKRDLFSVRFGSVELQMES